jgi:gamma-glutamylputrescine oxidase
MLLQKELSVTEDSYYEASVKRPAPCAPLDERIAADVCVVGGGFAGVSCALELATRGYSVALLEAQRIGWGASGRNGGQAIVGFGSDGECAIERQFPPEEARRAWDISVEGLTLLQQRIERYAIECDYTSGYMTLAVRQRKAASLRKWADHVTGTYRYPLHWIDSQHIGEWISSSRFVAGVFDPQSGHLHPLKFCLGLSDAARKAGVRVFENSPAYCLERGERPIVKTGEGQVSCSFVVLAGNVYLGEFGDSLAPELRARIMPVGTYMIATESMGKARAEGLMPRRTAVSDNNLVLDYFRLSADHRLLFGAGETYTATVPRNLVERMRKRMVNVFPQLADLAIDHAWGGFVDITMNRAPHFGRIRPDIFFLQGFSGHGLALAGMAGKVAAEAIAGQAERLDLFARVKHRRFPGGALMRTPALVLGMLYYRMRDIL